MVCVCRVALLSVPLKRVPTANGAVPELVIGDGSPNHISPVIPDDKHHCYFNPLKIFLDVIAA